MYKVFLDGLWRNNPGTVQLLGLCPLLAVSTTLANAFTLGLATLFVLICSNVLVSGLGRLIPSHLRLPFYVMIIAGFVTLTQLFLSMAFYNLYESLGIFLALITTNCLIMGRAEAFASRNSVRLALVDGLAHGLGFMAVLCIIGGLREMIGQVFLLALLPPGAFMLLAVIIAISNEGTLPPFLKGGRREFREEENSNETI